MGFENEKWSLRQLDPDNWSPDYSSLVICIGDELSGGDSCRGWVGRRPVVRGQIDVVLKCAEKLDLNVSFRKAIFLPDFQLKVFLPAFGLGQGLVVGGVAAAAVDAPPATTVALVSVLTTLDLNNQNISSPTI